MAFYDNSHQTYEKGIEKCAIFLVLSRYCLGDGGLEAVGTALLYKLFEKNETNQTLALSAFLKKH